MNARIFRLLLSAGFVSAASLSFAESASTPTPAPTSVETLAAESAPKRTSEEIEQLVAPIALYPDALIALILPAATFSSDLVLASRYLASHSDVSKIDTQSWDESVRGLARYAEVVRWMDENLEWTKTLGAAFVAQPAEVMNAIQRLRAKARAAGTLKDTPQQQVVVEEDNIYIVPARAEVIYVPRYDPEVVYYSRPSAFYGSFFTFGSGYSTGSWLRYDCDWHQRVIWRGPYHHAGWHHRHNLRKPVFPGRPGYVHHPEWRAWCPPTHLPRPRYHRPSEHTRDGHHHRHHLPRPNLPQGAPTLTYRTRRHPDTPSRHAETPKNNPTAAPSAPHEVVLQTKHRRLRIPASPAGTAPSFTGTPLATATPQPSPAVVNLPSAPGFAESIPEPRSRGHRRHEGDSSREHAHSRRQERVRSPVPEHRPAPSAPSYASAPAPNYASAPAPNYASAPAPNFASSPASPAAPRQDPSPRESRRDDDRRHRSIERQDTER